MSKGLEAFEKFCDDIDACVNSGGIHYIDKRNKDIIEQELKALEIIKNKPRLDLVYIRDTEDYNDYVMTLNIASYGLENEDVLIYATEEEYDLLKEVM